VIPVVAGSNPVGHPISPRKWQQPRIDCAGTPGAALVALVAAALAQMTANLAGAAAGDDPECLHQLRVAIRRLRALLRIFRKTGSAKRLDRQLRRLAMPLGEARDWDVFAERFAAGDKRQAAHARCRKVFPGLAVFAGEAQRWARASARADHGQLATFAGEALDRLHRQALKRARDIDWRDAEQRHALRIAVRRLRYGVDFFAGCFPAHGKTLRKLEELQNLLGELNDIAVARRLGGAELEAALQQRETALLRRLAPAWRAFEKRPRFWAGR
jgi:CHAD domain-containing protein